MPRKCGHHIARGLIAHSARVVRAGVLLRPSAGLGSRRPPLTGGCRDARSSGPPAGRSREGGMTVTVCQDRDATEESPGEQQSGSRRTSARRAARPRSPRGARSFTSSFRSTSVSRSRSARPGSSQGWPDLAFVEGCRKRLICKDRPMRRANVLSVDCDYDASDPKGYSSGLANVSQAVGGEALAVKVYELPAGESVCPSLRVRGGVAPRTRWHRRRSHARGRGGTRSR